MNNGTFEPQTPTPNGPLDPQRPLQDDAHKIASARKLTLAANIMGPVSLFIGGSFLSMAGLICAILGWRKVRDVRAGNNQAASQLQLAERATKISIGICAVALALNLVAVSIMMPAMLEAVQSGDISSITGTAPSVNSTWG